MEKLIEKLIKDYEDNVGSGVFEINKTVTREGMTNTLNKFVKQIRDDLYEEIYCESYHSPRSVTLENINEVFNKYIK